MAAVTLTGTADRHDVGDYITRFFNISGASGSTLLTPFINLYYIGVQPGSVITAVASARSIVNGSYTGYTLTFTSSGTMTNEIVMVCGRNG